MQPEYQYPYQPPAAGYGVPPYGPPGLPLRSLRVPAALSVSGLIAYIVLGAIDLVVAQLAIHRTLSAPGSPEGGTGLVSDLVVLLKSLLIVAIAPTFIVWLFLVLKNLVMRGIRVWAPGWAIGGWFIPVANLVLPALVVNGAVKGSNADSRRSGGTALVVIWWLLLLWGLLTGQAYIDHDYSPADEVSFIAGYNASANAPLIAAAALCIVIVRRVTRQHEARVARGR